MFRKDAVAGEVTAVVDFLHNVNTLSSSGNGLFALVWVDRFRRATSLDRCVSLAVGQERKLNAD